MGPTHLPVNARGRAKDSSVAVIPTPVVPEMVSAVAVAIVGVAVAAVVMETGVVVVAVAIGKGHLYKFIFQANCVVGRYSQSSRT